VPRVTWFGRQARRLDRFQRRHAVTAFPWAVIQDELGPAAGSQPGLREREARVFRGGGSRGLPPPGAPQS